MAPPACFPLGFLSEPPSPPPGTARPAMRRRASMANIADQYVPPSASDVAAAGGGGGGGWAGLRRSKSGEDLAELLQEACASAAAVEAAGQWMTRYCKQESALPAPSRRMLSRVGSMP